MMDRAQQSIFPNVKIDDEKMMRGAGVIPLFHLLIVDEKCVLA